MVLAEDFARDRYDFSYMIRQDNANTFGRWVDYRHLERMIRFVVVAGVEPDSKVDWREPHIAGAAAGRVRLHPRGRLFGRKGRPEGGWE